MVLCRIKVGLLKQFMVLTAEQTMRFRQLKTLVHQKLILAQPTLTVRITFTINKGYNVSNKPQVFYIRYWVSVAEDASWDDLRTENKYRNSAEWNGDKAETETTVKRSYEKLYKTGTIVDEGTDATGNKLATKKINYSVVINPTGDKLLTTSNTLTLTDTLSFEPSDNTSADLDLSSIHLYGVTLDTTTGNLVADHTNEIGHDRFTATYDSPNHT